MQTQPQAIAIPWQLQPYATFPLHAISVAGRCGCGDSTCKRAGKHPRVKWGGLDPGTHEMLVFDGSGRGLVCGRGLVVVDLDVRTGGKSGIAHFQSLAGMNGGEIPATFCVRTPSGGLHLYYRVPAGVQTKTSAGELGAGIDVRGDGGYVVLPGSPHTSGGVYLTANEAPIADCPAWLLALVTRKESEQIVHQAQIVQPIDIATPEGQRRARAFYDACVSYPASISGQSGHAALWNIVVYGVRASLLSPNVVYQLLAEHFNPRCSPPWSPNELIHKIKQAITHSRLPWNTVAPERWEEDLRALVSTLKNATDNTPPAIVEAARAADASVIVPRVKDGMHAYTFDPALHVHVLDGQEAPEKPRQISVSDTTLVLATAPAWRGVFQWDGFADHIVAVNPPCRLDAEAGGLSENDVARCQIWLERAGCKVTENSVVRAIRVAASRCEVDSLSQFILGLPEVSLDVAERTIRELALGMMQGVSPLAETFVRKTLISAVRRALVPGTKVDSMLVLFGEQDMGKSLAIEKLFGVEWYRSQMPDLGGRDASHALHAKWAVELGELDRVLRSESSTVKEFLTRTTDEYRAYNSGERVRRPRRCIFIGTTNEQDFLRADHEFRRYWPFEVGAKIDFYGIAAHRIDIWAAAAALARAGEDHWISKAEIEQAGILRTVHEQHTERDPWEAPILRAVEGRRHVQAGEAYVLAFGALNLQAGEKVDMKIARRVGLILRQAKWRRTSISEEGSVRNVFMSPNAKTMQKSLEAKS